MLDQLLNGFNDEMEKGASKYALKLLREGKKAAKVVEPAKQVSKGMQEYFFKTAPKTQPRLARALSGTNAARLKKKFVDIK